MNLGYFFHREAYVFLLGAPILFWVSLSVSPVVHKSAEAVSVVPNDVG